MWSKQGKQNKMKTKQKHLGQMELLKPKKNLKSQCIIMNLLEILESFAMITDENKVLTYAINFWIAQLETERSKEVY